MADKQINELVELTTASGTDYVIVYDNNESGSEKSKKMIVSNLILPDYWINGLEMANAADADHDITVSTGQTTDSTNSYGMELTSSTTKQIDASWAAGSDAGGLFSGTVAVSTWYHVFSIMKDSDGSIDVGFDTDVGAANRPGGYTAYRRLGSVYADASANIDPFTQYGDNFIWYNNVGAGWSNPGTGVRTITCRVPTGLEVIADVTIQAADYSPTGATYVNVRSYHQNTSQTANISNCDLWMTGTGASADSSRFRIRTNISGQVFTKQNQSNGDHRLYYTVNGWYDDRGKNG